MSPLSAIQLSLHVVHGSLNIPAVQRSYLSRRKRPLSAAMVDQNANSPEPIPRKPHASGSASVKEALSQPTVLKAGETMLIISLVLIFLLACTVSLHLYLRRRERRRRGTTKDKKKEKKGKEQPELPTQEKHVAELTGTPMCEIGESEPRHEMEDAEVDERHLQMDSERSSCHKSIGDQSDSDSVTGSEVDIEAGISWYDDSDERVEPGNRELAIYWARAM